MNIRALLTFYYINSQAQFADRNINVEIANSLLYVIESFFVHRGASFIIVISFERENTQSFYQDLSAILFGSYDDIKTEIVVNKGLTAQPELDKARMRVYNVLVVDSFKSFLNIDLATKVKNFDINEYYHIFLHNEDRFLGSDIQNILSYCWENYIINVNIEIQTAKRAIIVYSYFPFTEFNCNKVIPVEVNRFENGTMVNSELFPQKLQNMNRCPIRVVTWNLMPYMGLNRLRSGIQVIRSGFEGRLLDELSSLMNFTIEIIEPECIEERGTIIGNYTTGATNMLIKRIADVSLGSFWFTSARSRLLTASDSYFQSSNVAVLLENSVNYESSGILWFPFQWEASSALITAFVVILVISYVFDRSIKTKCRNRYINFVAWTLGLPSLTLPEQNSRRLFVMTWILFGLIIRAQYSGIIFHFLRNNLFRHSPTTISEVVNQEYTIILVKLSYDALEKTSLFTDTGLRYRIIDNNGTEPIFTYLEEHPNERLMSIAPLEYVLHSIGENRKVGILTLLKESFMLQNLCMYFSKHSFLVERVNLLIQRIYSSGHLDSWVRRGLDISYLKSSRPPKEIVIGQRELRGIYIIWLTMMIVALLVFCVEILSNRVKFLKKLF